MNKKKPRENVREGIEHLETRTDDSITGSGIIEKARVDTLGRAQRDFSKSEIPISAAELARLAMIRLGAGKPLSEIENSTLDDIIELTARCQWRIELSRESWGAYGAAFYEEAKDELEIPEGIQKIYSLTGIIDFDEGLKLIGVPGRGTKSKPIAEVRKEKFFPFYREWAIKDSRYSHNYRWDGVPPKKDEWTAPSEEEIREQYQHQIETGWEDPSALGMLAQMYAEWKKQERSEINRANASGPNAGLEEQ